MDPNSGLAILGTAIGSAKLIEKVLGPTAEYVGVGVREFAQHRVANVKRIFQWAGHFVGNTPPPGEGVPARVLRDVLDDGSYRDDELSACYYGGILASSRSAVPRDDRGASFTALVGRLTTYQLRAHYILYRTINDLYFDSGINLQEKSSRIACQTFIPTNEYIHAMGRQDDEPLEAFLGNVLFGLAREDLVDTPFDFGPHTRMKSLFPGAESAGIIFQPAALGVELFLWATGNSKIGTMKFCKHKIDVPTLDVPSIRGAKPTKPLEQANPA